jgi:hypothetical protein
MSYRILIFVSRKPGLSHSDFKTYYETSHLPLLRFFAGALFPKHHKRYYLNFDKDDKPEVLQGDKAVFDFDAIAEVSFDDKSHFQAFLESLRGEEAHKKLTQDEDKFSDRGKLKIVVVGDVQETKT